MKKLLVLSLGVLMMFGLVTCALSAEVPDEVTIGFVAGLSGDNAQAGQFKRDAVKVIEKELEATNGCVTIMGKQVKVNIIFEDTESKADISANAYRKCIDDYNVIAIVGPDESSMTLAGAPIAQEAGVPVVSTFATNPAVTQIGDYIFRACFLDPFQGKVAATFATNDLKAKTAGVIYSNADAYSVGLAEAFIANFKELGGEIPVVETYAGIEVKDFNAQLSNILAQQPDIIFMPNHIGELPLQIQQARAMGITGTFLGGDSWDVGTLVEVTGKELLEGAYYVSCFSPDNTSPAAQAWVKTFEEINNYRPGAHATLAYEAIRVVLNGLGKIETFSREALRDAIAATNLELPSGVVTFDAMGDPTKAAVIMEYKGGVSTYITTINP